MSKTLHVDRTQPFELHMKISEDRKIKADIAAFQKAGGKIEVLVQGARGPKIDKRRLNQMQAQYSKKATLLPKVAVPAIEEEDEDEVELT